MLLVSFFSCSKKYDGKDGIKTVYFPNSEKIQQVVEYREGKRIGELKEFYRNGNLKVRQFYKNDTLNDSSFYYYENGNIKSIQYLKNFKKEGAWKNFNEKGELYEETNYVENQKEGVSTKYTYRTGRLLQKLNYVSDMKEGKQEIFYNNGKPKAILYYHYDRPCMGTEEWNERGEIINNDFKITVRESNRLLLENKLSYFVKLENPLPTDHVFIITDKDPESYATIVYPLQKLKDEFVLEYKLNVGGFVMENVKIAAFRTTQMGNTILKTKAITVSANNY
jgi:antitoxin component YwqK of YwqJK toxin-antitoxin module